MSLMQFPKRTLSETATAEESRSQDNDALLLKRLDLAGIPSDRWPDVARVWAEYRRNTQSHGEDSEVAGRHRLRLETILNFPWMRQARERPRLAAIQERLDAEHHGMVEVKRAIVEYCALALHAGTAGRTITFQPIVLLGEPGVGKTSLARSIAAALGRCLAILSLAGAVDAEALFGFPSAYRGSRPGLLTETMIRAGSRDAVLVLDEIDKTQAARQAGRPADALLPLLDPTQHAAIVDNFLEIPLDYSAAIFILTANYEGYCQDNKNSRCRAILSA